MIIYLFFYKLHTETEIWFINTHTKTEIYYKKIEYRNLIIKLDIQSLQYLGHSIGNGCKHIIGHNV